MIGGHAYSFVHVVHNVPAKCTTILRIPAVSVGVPKRVQIMHTFSTGKLGRACETLFFFFINPRNVLRTSLVEASKLHFYLSLVLKNSSSEARGIYKDFCGSKICERKQLKKTTLHQK